jgi:hypothetical protein
MSQKRRDRNAQKLFSKVVHNDVCSLRTVYLIVFIALLSISFQSNQQQKYQ